jgi:hypothetical protein
MADTLAPLIVEFLAWLEREPRGYGEVMEAWRTSCPRLTVWEDAVDRGLITRLSNEGRVVIALTDQGRAFLLEHGRRLVAMPPGPENGASALR